jgi:hypothetical protein
MPAHPTKGRPQLAPDWGRFFGTCRIDVAVRRDFRRADHALALILDEQVRMMSRNRMIPLRL